MSIPPREAATPGLPRLQLAFVGVLMFTATSRVISPQYMVWLVGLAAVCLCFRSSRMQLPVYLVLAAAVHLAHFIETSRDWYSTPKNTICGEA